MDRLTLTIIAFQGQSCSPQSRLVEGERFTVGRGAECDWELADPSRHLSRVHCAVERVGNGYTVTDLSTNGTHLNDSEEPLGRNVSAEIHDGDHIAIGEYVIRVDHERPLATPGGPFLEVARPPGVFAPLPPDPIPPGQDPFLGLLSDPATSPFGISASGLGGSALPGEASPSGYPGGAFPGVGFSGADAPPLPPAPSLAHVTGPDPDHVPALNAHFRPPDIHPALIPTDWQALDAAEPPPAAPAAFVPSPSPVPPPPIPAPHRAVVAPPPPAPAGDGLRAFLDGAGLGAAALPPGDDAERLRAYGTLFRALVAGLRELVAGRALVKSTLHMPQTVIAARDNNPFKFTVEEHQLLTALLTSDAAGYSEPLSAVHEAVADLKSHELAMVAAIQQALNTLVASLSPHKLKTEAEAAGLLGNLLPSARKAAWWDRYEHAYQRIADGIEADLPGGFRRAFIQAYLEQVGRL